MKHLKVIFVFTIVSLIIFYIGAALIEGTLVIADMDKSIRQVVFGCWLSVVVIGTMGYMMDANQKK